MADEQSILAPVAALSLPDSAALASGARQVVDFVSTFEITSGEEYELATDELRSIKVRAKRLEEQRTSITGPINEALRGINNLFRGPSDLLAEAERVIKGKLLAWDAEQKRIADEARRAAEAAAAAERERLAQEAKARQREAEQQAAAAAAAEAAGDAIAAQVAAAAAARAQDEAQSAAIATQMVVAAPAVTQPAPVKGVSTATRIDFEIVSLEKLVAHVAAHPELLPLVTVDSTRMRAYVRGLGAACALPGVRVFDVQTMRVRAS